MKKLHVIVILGIVLGGSSRALFSAVPFHPIQTADSNQNIILLRPSAERISTKEKQFQQLFKTYERNQIIAAAVAGVVLGITAAMVLEYFFKVPAQQSRALSNPENVLNQLHEQNVHMFTDLQIQYLQERAERSTVKGRMKWAGENVLSMVLYGLAGTVATKILSSLIPNLTQSLRGLFGDQHSILLGVGLTMMNDTQKLAQSLRACEQVSIDIGKNDPMLSVVGDYKIRNVIVDHRAFIESLESLIALIITMHEMASDDDQQKYNFEMLAADFLELVVPIIDYQEKALTRFKNSHDAGEIRAVIGGLKNIYGECERLLHNFGSVSYENDERNVSEEVQ